jgi:hypothetical protein
MILDRRGRDRPGRPFGVPRRCRNRPARHAGTSLRRCAGRPAYERSHLDQGYRALKVVVGVQPSSRRVWMESGVHSEARRESIAMFHGGLLQMLMVAPQALNKGLGSPAQWTASVSSTNTRSAVERSTPSSSRAALPRRAREVRATDARLTWARAHGAVRGGPATRHRQG